MTTFDVVCVVCEKPEITRTTIERLSKFAPKDSTLIFVMNGCSEEYWSACVRDFPEAVMVKTEKRIGVAAARNIGLKRASGEIVFSIDDDVWVDEGWYEESLRVLQEYEDVALVGPCGVLINEILPWDFDREDSGYEDREFWGNPSPTAPPGKRLDSIPGMHQAIKLDRLRAVGCFDEAYDPLVAQDADLCMKLKEKGWSLRIARAKVHHFGEGTCSHKQAEELVGKSIKEIAEKSLRLFYDRWHDKPHLLEGQWGTGPVSKTEPPLQLEVCGGIGDFVWLYSKLVALNLPLDITFSCEEGHDLSGLLKLLPNVSVYRVGSFGADIVLKAPDVSSWDRRLLIDKARAGPVSIQLNDWLEKGNRIEGWMPDFPTTFHFPIQGLDVAQAQSLMQPWTRWWTFYCANTASVLVFKGWGAEDWAEMGRLMMGLGKADGVALVGSVHDVPFIEGVVQAMDVPVKNLVGQLDLAASLSVVQGGLYLVAFPSGIPILAEVLSCRVMMFYPAMLVGLESAWADPAMIESGDYKGCQFCPPSQAFDWIKNEYRLGKKLG